MEREYFDAIPENKIKVRLGWYNKNASFRIEGIWYQGYDFEQTTFSFENYQGAIDSYRSKYGSDPYENVNISIECMGTNDYGYKYVGCYLLQDFFHQFLSVNEVKEFRNL
jgi:hypothetical protein